jgi:hypothetical protein
MLLADLLVGVLVSVLLTGPLVYLGLAARTGMAVTYAYAVAVALLALVAGALATLLLGWLPVAGVLVGPFAWTVTVRTLTRAEWPLATLLGVFGWTLATGAFVAL